MSLILEVSDIVESSNSPLLKAYSSWPRVALGEVAVVQNGFAFKSSFFSKTAGLPLIRIRDIDVGTTVCRYEGPYEAPYVVARGDLLVGMDGEFKVARWMGETGLLNQRVCRIVPDSRFYEQSFLALVLPGYLDAIHAFTSSQTVTHLSSRSIEQIPLPLPPIAEQKRIVVKVQELHTHLDAARERLERLPRVLRRLQQAVLAAGCSGRLTEDWRNEQSPRPAQAPAGSALIHDVPVKIRRGVPDEVEVPESVETLELPLSWAKVAVASLLRSGSLVDVKDGNHGANHPKATDFADAGLPFITAAQVGEFTIDYEAAPKVRGEALNRLRVGFAKPGDAILTHKGSVGRTAVCTRDCVLAPQTTYYRCDNRVIDSSYLTYYFASVYFYRQLAAVMSQTTRDFVPISEQYKLFIFLPPIEEQREIGQRVEALWNLTAATARRVRVASELADRVPAAILAKAFRGELTAPESELARSEGRDYEPAQALIKRIKAEHAVTSRDGQLLATTRSRARGTARPGRR